MELKGHLYDEVPSGDSLSSADDNIRKPYRARAQTLTTIILAMISMILGITCIFLWSHNECNARRSEYGYATDWSPARSALKIQRDVVYTSALRYNDTSDAIYRDFDPAAPKYAGEPSQEIDDAWAELLKGQYLIVPPEIAMEMDDPVPISGMYLAEVEVMHSLHCLNAIRKALDPEYYSTHESHKLPSLLQKMHVVHCFEQLRQTIQCAGDLTPVPLRPYGNASNTELIGTPMSHTCRNWDTFRQWYTERGAEWGTIGGM